MADKIELTVIGLANSDMQAGSYAVILEEHSGSRRLPIIIGGAEAQAIATVLENVTPSRPGTHDLFKNTLTTMNMGVTEIVISDLVDGVFYANLTLLANGKQLDIDSRSSDAIAMALRFDCPIYTYDFILDEAGIVMEEESREPRPDKKASEEKKTALRDYSISELNNLLGKVLEKEDYESAAKIRDEIARKKEQEG
jgi:bifunctional DNase/RNase